MLDELTFVFTSIALTANCPVEPPLAAATWFFKMFAFVPFFQDMLVLVLTIGVAVSLYILVKAKKNLRKYRTEIIRLKEMQEDFRKSIDEEVKRRTREYEQELKDRQAMGAELKKALKKAEDAIFLKNAFLSNISHEIRTPLNAVIGFSSLLENELSLAENVELYEYANGITQSGDRLMRLLNNIIDISRIEANDLEVNLEACDLNRLASDISELFIFKANEKGLKFNVINGNVPHCLADPDNLMRILTEIIDNSLKYTEKGFINISIGHDDVRQLCYIRIKDTGIGIDPEYIPHIFEAFRQESLGFSRTFQGAGLGLPLARRIVDLMQGRIEISSEKGHGTTVTVFLKDFPSAAGLRQDKARPQEIKYTSGLEFQTSLISILVVEDDRMNRMVLKKMLVNISRLDLAPNGEEALKMIRQMANSGNPYDVVLMDINLPAPWDGVKLMKRIREDFAEYRKRPFIAQTAYAMSGDRERFLDAGFDDYISKPVSKNQLLSMIETQLKMSRHE